jgi:hypothetical protein
MVIVPTEFNWLESRKALAKIEVELKDLASNLTEAQFQAPPRVGGWSVGYCIEHLVLTGHDFLGRWGTAMKEARGNGRGCGRSFRYRWWQRALLQFTEPPYRMKTKTSQLFLPCARRSMQETIQRFLSMHQSFAEQVTSSRGLDVERTRVQSPFASWVWYPLGFSFDLALAHERRHLWQARQVQRQFTDQR